MVQSADQLTLQSAEQLKAVLDQGERVEAITPELYPFETHFPEIPEPTDQDDWLAQFNESRDSFTVNPSFD